MQTLDSVVSSNFVWGTALWPPVFRRLLELKLIVSYIMINDWVDFHVVKKLWKYIQWLFCNSMSNFVLRSFLCSVYNVDGFHGNRYAGYLMILIKVQFSSVLHKNLHCGYSLEILELPWQEDSNEYPQQMFQYWNMENYTKIIIKYPLYESPHDKTNKMTVRPTKTQISLGIRPVWSESYLCAQRVAKDPRFLHADSEDSDQTGRMPRLIWVFAGRTCHFVGFVMRRLISVSMTTIMHKCTVKPYCSTFRRITAIIFFGYLNFSELYYTCAPNIALLFWWKSVLITTTTPVNKLSTLFLLPVKVPCHKYSRTCTNVWGQFTYIWNKSSTVTYVY